MSALDLIMSRASVRRFKPQTVPDEVIEKIVGAGQRAPSACNLQPYSLIVVRDSRKRQEVIEAIGAQACMREAPLWIFVCLDYARPMELLQHVGVEPYIGELSRLVFGLVDASLVAGNIVLAAQALGLGSVFVASIFNNLEKLAQVLRIPHGTLPVALICLGYPREDPPLRPRWPMRAVLHEEEYSPMPRSLVEAYYEEANRALLDMNYFRTGVGSLAEHYRSKFSREVMEANERRLRDALSSLGFLS